MFKNTNAKKDVMYSITEILRYYRINMSFNVALSTSAFAENDLHIQQQFLGKTFFQKMLNSNYYDIICDNKKVCMNGRVHFEKIKNKKKGKKTSQLLLWDSSAAQQ